MMSFKMLSSACAPLLRPVARVVRVWLRERYAEWTWRREGCLQPAPPHIKRALLRGYARKHRLRIFVETGTLHGDTLSALRRYFQELHSIELCPELYKKAALRFANDRKIRLWQGDSGDVLPRVLEVVRRPALFWLDGHYSGEGTARGVEGTTPILRELAHISSHKLSGEHLVIVDDARYFYGRDGYPEKSYLRSLTRQMGFRTFEEVGDFLVIR
jgi:hypothetical protein